MHRYLIVIAAILAVWPIAGYAHKGATGAIKARMDGMVAIASNMKAMGSMLAGKTIMDRQEFAKHASAVSNHARQIPLQFKNMEMSEFSEALPAIWKQPKRFNKISNDLQKKAVMLSEAAINGERADLQVLFRRVGVTCSACHKDFRAKK